MYRRNNSLFALLLMLFFGIVIFTLLSKMIFYLLPIIALVCVIVFIVNLISRLVRINKTMKNRQQQQQTHKQSSQTRSTSTTNELVDVEYTVLEDDE